MSAHIPDAQEKTTLLSGWYSSRTRGYRKRHELFGATNTAAPVPEAIDLAPPEVGRSWVRPIRQVSEGDPLRCLRCQSTRRVIAVIERPPVIRRSLVEGDVACAGVSRRSTRRLYLADATSEESPWLSPPTSPRAAIPRSSLRCRGDA